VIKSDKPKESKCKNCREKFIKTSSLACCSMACALDYVNKQWHKKKDKEAKEFNSKTRALKQSANDKSPSFWADKAQKECNRYILLRDKDKPCISCGNTNNVKYDAGHYVSRGHSAALRFNEFNINKQCSAYCNVANSGQSIKYRQALVRIYGEEKVLWLEGPHEMPRYRIDDYKRIHAEFKQKIKELENKLND